MTLIELVFNIMAFVLIIASIWLIVSDIFTDWQPTKALKTSWDIDIQARSECSKQEALEHSREEKVNDTD